MKDMWLDFSDFELCQVAFTYGLADSLEFMFDHSFRLTNRDEIERLLTLTELNMLEVISYE